MNPQKTWRQMMQEDLKNPAFKKEYELAKIEIEEMDQFIRAREAAGLTQAEVAEKMKTSQSAVARLEAKLCSGKFPSIGVLSRYADALGKRIVINFV